MMNLPSLEPRWLAILAATALAASPAAAHIAVSSGPAPANATSKIVFGVGHGCAGADTLSVTIEIPAGVTSVRAVRSDFGKPALQKNGAGAVTSVTWQKVDAEVLDADDGYYELTLRVRTPDAPFTRLFWRIHQTCRAMDGTETTVPWVALPGESGEPAAPLVLLPARRNGWNAWTLPTGASVAPVDMARFFGDAQIVWRGLAAYSASPTIAALVAATPGVTALTELAAGDEIWVKY
ncbi:MAG: DUF1775 domain-containing protein [Kofleriaceae bacterium]|nr:DUF1775 domain-containing protein [Kofleriaceae bacterium]MCL4227325.1 DUF1775 domain-containing protein [Myxococcales bacterium]